MIYSIYIKKTAHLQVFSTLDKCVKALPFVNKIVKGKAQNIDRSTDNVRTQIGELTFLLASHVDRSYSIVYIDTEIYLTFHTFQLFQLL